MTTIETLTDTQLEALRNEAGSAGDLEMVAICNAALGTCINAATQQAAREICVKAIRNAEAQG